LLAAMMVAVACAGGWTPATAQTAPVMTSAAPPPGSVGTPYLHQFTAGPLDLLFAVTGANVPPPGLLVTPQGFLVGVPTTAGTFGPVTVCATSLLFPPTCQVFTMTIARRSGDLLVAPSPGGPLGTPLRATATLLGSLVPIGSLTFRLFDDPSCTRPVFSSENPLTAFGAATSDDFLPPIAGVYRWTVHFRGDANNEPVSALCHTATNVVITGSTPPTTVPTTSTTTPTTVPGPSGARYVPLSPARIADTRTGAGGLSGAVGPGATVAVQVGGAGVPATATAVVMNVTVTQPTARGSLTLSPDGRPRPLVPSMSFTPGQTVARLVVVELGAGGRVATFNSAGDTHVIYDVTGYFIGGAGSAGRYQPLVPARIADTRFGAGGVRLGPQQSLDLQVTGMGGAPAHGVSAALLNVAATSTTAESYLTVYPTGESQPSTANLSFAAGETVSNSAMVKVGAGGKVTVYNNAGETDVVVDIAGTYTDASVVGSTGGYTPLAPARIYDTRLGSPSPAGSTEDVQVTGVGGVPSTGVRAVIVSVAVARPAGPGSLTTFPSGTAQPLTSDLNYAAGETRSNLVVVQVGAGGSVAVSPSTTTHVIVDVVGWFS
jgi:hypothetical protein